MKRWVRSLAAAFCMTTGTVQAQSEDVAAIRRQLDAIKDPESEKRIPALYNIKSIAVASADSDVKFAALSLLREPVKSSLDHIRVPAVYAIVDIAHSSDDPAVARFALEALDEPPKGSDWSDTLVERAYAAEFRIRGSMKR